MSNRLLLDYFKKKIAWIILIGTLAGAFCFGLSIWISENNYKMVSDILIVQNQDGFTDFYALSKSADYLSKVLTETIYSEKFLEEMEASGKIKIADFLPPDKRIRLKEWNKMVKVERNSESGILKVTLYGENKVLLQKIAAAFLEVLMKKNYLFLGKGQNLEVRVISGPILERKIEQEEIPIVTIFGALAGWLGAGLMFLLVFTIRESVTRKRELENFNAYYHNQQ